MSGAPGSRCLKPGNPCPCFVHAWGGYLLRGPPTGSSESDRCPAAPWSGALCRCNDVFGDDAVYLTTKGRCRKVRCTGLRWLLRALVECLNLPQHGPPGVPCLPVPRSPVCSCLLSPCPDAVVSLPPLPLPAVPHELRCLQERQRQVHPVHFWRQASQGRVLGLSGRSSHLPALRQSLPGGTAQCTLPGQSDCSSSTPGAPPALCHIHGLAVVLGNPQLY